jgi:hypothetical protein
LLKEETIDCLRHCLFTVNITFKSCLSSEIALKVLYLVNKLTILRYDCLGIFLESKHII